MDYFMAFVIGAFVSLAILQFKVWFLKTQFVVNKLNYKWDLIIFGAVKWGMAFLIIYYIWTLF